MADNRINVDEKMPEKGETVQGFYKDDEFECSYLGSGLFERDLEMVVVTHWKPTKGK